MKTFRFRITIVLIFAILGSVIGGYFVLLELNSDKPEIVIAIGTIVLAWATLMLGLATLGLALVAFYEIEEGRRHNERALIAAREQNEAAIGAGRDQTQEAIEAARKQNEEIQRNALRPLIIPEQGINPPEMWKQQNHPMKIRNVGPGVATNISGVILPREENFTNIHQQFSVRYYLPLASDQISNETFTVGGTLLSPRDKLADDLDIYLGPPALHPGAVNYLDRHERFGCRLTFTYSDVFGVKHASIYDQTENGAWVLYRVLNDIPNDIRDLDLKRGPQEIEDD